MISVTYEHPCTSTLTSTAMKAVHDESTRTATDVDMSKTTLHCATHLVHPLPYQCEHDILSLGLIAAIFMNNG